MLVKRARGVDDATGFFMEAPADFLIALLGVTSGVLQEISMAINILILGFGWAFCCRYKSEDDIK